MKNIWEFYENMNALVYVADMDTYELIYMNAHARKMYGFASVEELKGKKCYEVLQGGSVSCAICNNNKLRSGYFEEWSYFNPLHRRTYLLKDTMIEQDQRRYRMEIATNLSPWDHHSETTAEEINHESIINDGLRVALGAPTEDDSIKVLLEYIGKVFKCERVYIFEDEDEKYYKNTYEWCARGITLQKDNLQNIPIADVGMWLERFEKYDNVIIRDIDDIKETDPVMYDYLLPQDIKSLVVSPLYYKNKIIGFYGVDNPPETMMENISQLFTIMGYFIVVLLRRRNLFRKLETISYSDQLTGFGNRHAMDCFMESLQPSKSIGVVYCDVTGLKRVNDTSGHREGDALLLRACECLKEVFEGYAMFRLGGDEFLVICSGISETELYEKEAALKDKMKKYSCILAVGCVWHQNSEENMDRLLMEADQRMYEDKRKHYEEMNMQS